MRRIWLIALLSTGCFTVRACGPNEPLQGTGCPTGADTAGGSNGLPCSQANVICEYPLFDCLCGSDLTLYCPWPEPDLGVGDLPGHDAFGVEHLDLAQPPVDSASD
jgi:hypothetical protein